MSDVTGTEPAKLGTPVPLLDGSFAIFQPAPDELLLVWRQKGSTEDRYLPIPAFVVRMAAQQAGVAPADLVTMLRGADK